ncbi:F-box/kelch-repeat protein At1g57790-like [Lotus japonicus]|uniref:F-box/kelch-repeat protein At1g57790-like n=1 Tax=Lotus japonicus TaxID=34305 RepID=UPI0025874A94|nr:F-box/kelch-repeat protein At1g57790-like [Lotus japonicus]
MKDNGIQKVELFDADDSTMDALAGSGIEVMVTIPNKQLVVGVLRPQVHSKEHGNFVVIKMTNPKVLSAAVSPASPASPLSFSRSESDEKLKAKPSLASKREHYLRMVELEDHLTKTKESLNQAIDKVKSHYDQLKKFNLKLRERKQQSYSSMAATRERREWSDLPPELLELVLRRLVLKDYLKCRQVCRSWRSKVNDATKTRCPLSPQFPSLLLLPIAHSLIRNEDPATLLDNITAQNINRRQRTFIPTHLWEGFSALVRSQEGWLMFQDLIIRCNSGHSLFWIFNPVSREKYKLPRIRLASPHLKVSFSYAPDSQDLFVVIGSLGKPKSTPHLCFCRVSDKSWTRIETPFKDIMLLGWKLYVVNDDSVTIFNLRDSKSIRLVLQLPKLRYDGKRSETCRLVRDSTCEQVLLILYTSEYKDIRIFKFDMSSPNWTELESLSGRALFVDRTGAHVISAANFNTPLEFAGGNCVFFSVFKYNNPRIVVFFLKEKKIRHLDISSVIGGNLWFTPSPW